ASSNASASINNTGAAATLTAGQLNTNTTFSGKILGNIALVKTGGGTLTLTGASTYNGGLTINAGVVSINTDAPLGIAPATATPGSITLTGGGALTASAAFTINTNRGIALSGLGGLGTNSGATIYGGVIAGSGILFNSGGGTFSLTGPNTFTGAYYAAGGIIQVNNANALGDSGNFLLANSTVTENANISLGGLTGFAGTITIATGETMTVNQAAGLNSIYNGVLAGLGNFTMGGPGTLALSGSNTLTGGLNINGGTLLVASGTNLGAGTVAFGGGRLEIGVLGAQQSMGALSPVSASGFSATQNVTIGAAGGTIDVTGNVIATLSGTLSGPGSLAVTDAGTLSLTGTNTFGGVGQSVSVNDGTLAINSDASLGDPNNALILNAGTLVPLVNISTAREVTLGAGGGTFDVVLGQPLGLTGTVDGTGSLTKIDTGTLVLDGANTYSGGTIMAGGMLNLAPGVTALGTGPVTLDGGTLQVLGSASSPTTTIDTLNVGGGALEINGYLGPNTVQVNNLNRTGAGSLVLIPFDGSGGNLGTTEVLNLPGAAGLVANGILPAYLVAQTSTTNTTGDFTSLNLSNNVITATAAGVYSSATTLDATTSTSVFLANSGTTNVLANGADSVYALRVDGVNITDGGATTLSVGSGTGQAGVILNNAGGTAAGIAVNSLAFGAAEGVVYTSGDLANSISSPISGSAGLTVFGSGMLALSGTNLYTGGTTINGATLSVGADANLGGSGDLTLSAGTLLAGSSLV
ncbi:MAG TPA: autotransporter-associated beta strand repeat-containing protein, partial [Pirellulales bacterium]